MFPILSLFFTTLVSLASGPEISPLTHCSYLGWDIRRVVSSENLRFVTFDNNKTCAAEFTIRPTDPKISNGWRAEIKDPFTPPAGSTLEYSFDTLVPASLRNVNKARLVIAQWHDKKSDPDEVQRPPFSIRLWQGQVVFPLFNQAIYERNPLGRGQNLASFPIPYGRWMRFRVKATWSASAEGSIEVWMNGRKVVDFRGPVSYPADPTSPYLKLGAYTTFPFSAPITIYHTNYRRSLIR